MNNSTAGMNRQTELEYIYSQINTDIEKTFSYEQKSEVRKAIQKAIRVPSKKIIDFRTQFWFIKKLYIVIFIGKDLRSKGRMPENSIVAFIRYGISTICVFLMVGVLLIFMLFVLYIVKSMLGIDLFEDYHLSNLINMVKQLFF